LGHKRANHTHFPATQEFEVANFMPVNPLCRQPQDLGLRNPLPEHGNRLRRIEFTNSAAHASSLPSLAKGSSSLLPEISRSEGFEIAVGRGSSVSRERAVLISGFILKRMVDISFSVIALLFLWPLLLVIALAIRLESPGPSIYASLRAGKNGQTFSCYKFRTMFDGADALRDSLRQFNERQDPFFKIAEDPRVSRLGHFLRMYSLDELPQFWNVLKGDMSLVGPRPHPVDDYARYRPGDRRRLDVKPGITGLWQVTARTNPSFETCMTLDLEYMKNWSLLLDFKILMRTAHTVLSGDGQ
jgi:lipopolysaccharide/colanic/teichoic acid biosynthesis glycosyltransferase